MQAAGMVVHVVGPPRRAQDGHVDPVGDEPDVLVVFFIERDQFRHLVEASGGISTLPNGIVNGPHLVLGKLKTRRVVLSV